MNTNLEARKLYYIFSESIEPSIPSKSTKFTIASKEGSGSKDNLEVI